MPETTACEDPPGLQVVGYAEKYETTQDPHALQAVQNFFGALTTNHSYATGGSNAKVGAIPLENLPQCTDGICWCLLDCREQHRLLAGKQLS